MYKTTVAVDSAHEIQKALSWGWAGAEGRRRKLRDNCSDQGEHDLVLLGAKRMLLCGEGGWDGYVLSLHLRAEDKDNALFMLSNSTSWPHTIYSPLCRHALLLLTKKKCIYSRSQESFLSLSIFLCCFIFGFGFVYLLMVWEMDIHSCPLKVISKEKSSISTNSYQQL